MRVVDLDRDMRDVIPTGTSRDSAYLFERMTGATFAALGPVARRRVLDVAGGFGQDAAALQAAGAQATVIEPSARMSALAKSQCADAAAPALVRGWADALPFAADSFDAGFCKGALDHFDKPERALAELARVTRAEGRVVLAVANFESLSCRLARLRDNFDEAWLVRPMRRGRRHYDVPADHFTRYDLALLREQAAPYLEHTRLVGVSLGWGLLPWSRLLERLPLKAARALLRLADTVARCLPGLADVVVLTGRPRKAAGQVAKTSRAAGTTH